MVLTDEDTKQPFGVAVVVSIPGFECTSKNSAQSSLFAFGHNTSLEAATDCLCEGIVRPSVVHEETDVDWEPVPCFYARGSAIHASKFARSESPRLCV